MCIALSNDPKGQESIAHGYLFSLDPCGPKWPKKQVWGLYGVCPGSHLWPEGPGEHSPGFTLGNSPPPELALKGPPGTGCAILASSGRNVYIGLPRVNPGLSSLAPSGRPPGWPVRPALNTYWPFGPERKPGEPRHPRRSARKGPQIEPSHNTHEKRINQYRSQSLNVVFAHLSIVPIKKRPRQ
jgi:hypothetical protein